MATKTKRQVPERTITHSTKTSNWITPYQYGKRNDVRPQQVYQWVLKQGAPAKEIAGKIYVNAKEIDEWLSKKDERKTDRANKRVEKAQEEGTVSPELLELLMNQKLNLTKAFCTNEEEVTEWWFEIQWTDIDYTGPYKIVRCIACKLNMREYPLDKERAIQAMKNEITLRVPLHSSLKSLGEEEEWLSTNPPEGWEPRPPDEEDEEEFQDDGTGEDTGDDSGVADDDEYAGGDE